ncbi:MAG: AAA domain-containing protein [Culicoidibacterales bacterium]
MVDKILKRYKNRLVNINSNNRSLYLRRLDAKYSFDLFQTNQFYPEQIDKIYQHLITRTPGKIQLFPDMIEFRHRFEQQIHRQIQQEQNQALADLNAQKQALGVSAYTQQWEKIEAQASKKRDEAKRELTRAVEKIEKQQKALAMLHRECIAQSKETGRYELKIGYPFIKGKFLDETLVHAPLFLFSAVLERGANNTWYLRLDGQSPIINRVFLLAVQKYNQTPIALDVIEKFSVEKIDLTSEHLYRQLLRQFSLHIDWQSLPLQPFPEPMQLDQELKATVIGSFKIEHHLVVGNFPIANSLYHDYEKLQQVPQLPKTIEHLFAPAQSHPQVTQLLPVDQQYFLTALDESQEQAIALTQQQPYSVIYGPPGTGKSQTIANLIGQSLAKNKRVLVVSHKKAALDVIYNRIPKLQEQAVLLHQPTAQAEQFFQKTTTMLETKEAAPGIVEQLNHKLNEYNQQLQKILAAFDDVAQFLQQHHVIGLTVQEMYTQSIPIQMRRDPRYDLMRFWQSPQTIEALDFPTSVQLQTKLQQYQMIGKAHQVQQMKANPYVTLFAKLSNHEQVQLERQFQQTLHFFNGEQKSWQAKQQVSDPAWNLKYWSQIVHISHNLAEFSSQLAVQKQTLTHDFSQFYEQLQCLETVIPQAFWQNFTTALEKGNYDQLAIYLQQVDEALELLAKYEQLDAELQKLTQEELQLIEQLFVVFETKEKVESFVQSLPELLILQNIRQAETQTSALVAMEQFKNFQNQAQHVLQQKFSAVQEYLRSKHQAEMVRCWQKQPHELEALYHQVTKKRQITTIRESIHQYAQAYFTLFPCWLASPETIADIFPLTTDLFDIVIFDEASQLAVEQTIPVFYRGKQVVIVGDDQQLKPPQMFTLKFDDDMAEAETDVSYQAESILDLAKLKYPSVKLNYHYRSQASELIAFSNAAFYENDLMVTTDVIQQRSAKRAPIERFKVNGIWREQTNIIEAYQIVALVVEVFKQKRREDTVGVITFNSKQKDLILDLLEQYTQEDTVFAKQYFLEQERFVDGEDVSFFVKNIENVQGDERDIILFSSAYAPNSQGKMSMNFGSLSQEGGENRLNVAITRARKKIYLVTSIEPEELDVEQTKFAGAKLLKAYLTYARAVSTGNTLEKELVLRQLQHQRPQIETTQASEFARQLALNLEMRGYQVKQNLGTKMYQLDLAIYDPQKERYVLGIECDTPLNQAKTAKHRDLVKQSVLASFGWKTMRVWSRDWWLDKEKVLQTIEQRLADLEMERELADE